LQFGPNDPNTISSQMSVVGALERIGNISEALKLASETKENCKTHYPDDLKLEIDADRYMSWLLLQNGDLDEAEKLAKQAFEIASSRVADESYIWSSKSVYAAALISNGKLDEAVELYGNFPTYSQMDKETELQGSIDPDKSEVLFIVFWEAWCPFCDRMMSRVERLYRQYKNYGIDVIGVTGAFPKITTDEDRFEFLEKNDITFHNIKESGMVWRHFNCGGVPSIRLIYKGKLIWEKDVPSVEPISRHMVEGIIKATKRADAN
jgi:thiol-disulfide isomerase/thioredoxin